MLPQQPVSGCESRLHNTSCEEEGVYRVARYSSAVALLLRWRNFRIFRVGLAAGGHVRLAATFFAAGEPEDLETGSSAWWAQGAKEDWAGARSPELVVRIPEMTCRIIPRLVLEAVLGTLRRDFSVPFPLYTSYSAITPSENPLLSYVTNCRLQAINVEQRGERLTRKQFACSPFFFFAFAGTLFFFTQPPC